MLDRLLNKLSCLLGFHSWYEVFIFDVDESLGEFIQATGSFGCLKCGKETSN